MNFIFKKQVVDDLQQNKELKEKIKEIIEELERTNYGYWTLELLYDKIKKNLDLSQQNLIKSEAQ